MSFAVELLNESVISVFVRYEKSSFDRTAVRVQAVAQRVVENFLIQIHVVHVDGTVEGNRNQLRYLFK